MKHYFITRWTFFFEFWCNGLLKCVPFTMSYQKYFLGDRYTLKTLYHFRGTISKEIVELWSLCCIMMFRRVNKQPGNIQKFRNLCCYDQDIYDWISPFNKPSGSWFILILHTVYMGKWKMVFLVTCIFSLFEALYNAFEFEVQIFRASFLHPITDTDSMQGHAA